MLAVTPGRLSFLLPQRCWLSRSMIDRMNVEECLSFANPSSAPLVIDF
jgi:hypothetical protein